MIRYNKGFFRRFVFAGIITFILVSICYVTITVVRIRDALNHDYPYVAESILIRFFDFQNQFYSSNGRYCQNPPAEFLRLNDHDKIVRLYMPDSGISRTVCSDCHIEEASFKLIAIEKFKRKGDADGIYNLVSIDHNRLISKIRSGKCNECTWEEVELNLLP